ncbi:hypothetical protein MMC21_005298 [Puttea exsequens]|nr:hypothetical protein [Puttea exsequens]
MAPIGHAGIVLLAVTWVLFGVSLIVVCLRLYADVLIVKLIRVDSYLTFFTFLLVIVSQILTQIYVNYGIGTHITELTPNYVVLALKYSWIATSFQLLAVAFGKLAAVTYLATIKGPRHAKSQIAFLWAVGISQWLITFVLLGFIYGQCDPVAKLWNAELEGKCDGRMRNTYAAYVYGSISAFSNICIALYPTLIFWQLQMKLTRKVILCLLFSSGVIAGVSAIIKTTKIGNLGKTKDITYDMTSLMIWTAIEQYTVLLAGSIPPLRPAFHKHVTQPIADKVYNRSHHFSNLRDEEANLTSHTTPPGAAYVAGAKGRSDHGGEGGSGKDSSENILGEMGGGAGIMLTTKIEVERRLFGQRAEGKQ